MTKPLSGQVALITGASRGLGAATAVSLLPAEQLGIAAEETVRCFELDLKPQGLMRFMNSGNREKALKLPWLNNL